MALSLRRNSWSFVETVGRIKLVLAQRLPPPGCVVRELGYLQKLRVLAFGILSQTLNLANFLLFFAYTWLFARL